VFRSGWPAVFGREVFGRPSAWTSRTVRATPVAHGPSVDEVRTVRVLECSSGRSVDINGPSARG
jgi:hypothetical protein